MGYDEKKMRFVGNGYDLDQFKPGRGSLDNLDDLPIFPDGAFIFVTVARWDPQKDHRNLLEAVDLLSDISNHQFVCFFVGPNMNSSNSELRKLIHHHGVEDRVFLCGSSSNVTDLMNFSDCHILPSAFGEAFPNVVAEALACSVPCIVTNVGDAADMVGDYGWVVEPRNPSGLAAAMNEVLEMSNSGENWRLLREKCRERAIDNLSVQKMIDSYRSVWREA